MTGPSSFVDILLIVDDRLRARPLTAALLDGVNAAAIGLMAAVSVQLGTAAIRDPLTLIVTLGAGATLFWGRVPSVLLVAIGGLAGVAAGAAGIGP